MRGKIAAIILLVGAIATASAQPRGLFIIQQPSQAPTPLSAPPAEGDVLEFLDGSVLHGSLKQVDVNTGLRWESPVARKPIALRATQVDSIRFAHSDSVTVSPTAHLRFANGDDLLGSLISLDNERLGFSTWFGKTLTVPRASVQSVTFLSSNYTLIYDGPGDTDGWIIGNHNPEGWIYRDGTFISGMAGSLSRDFKLTGSSTVEFDLAWTENFELSVDLYSDSPDRPDYNSYLLQIRPDEVSLRHIESYGSGPARSFGSAPLHLESGVKKARVTVQANKDEGTIAIYVDKVLVKRWKDEGGFGATGTGISFQQQTISGGVIKLSNIMVSQWSGHYEPETSFVATNTDVVRFINHDQAAGKIAGIDHGRISLAFGDTTLQVPLHRVTQINFAAADAAAIRHGPWEVRAHFPRGGSICFRLEKWTDKEVAGQSDIFGTLAFQPGEIRQLEFNLGQPRTTPAFADSKSFESLDE
jgi:hypothetical protein